MAKFNHIDVRGTKKVPSAFGNVFICSGAATDAKTITFPDGYLNGATPEPNLAFKAVFPNGHNAANASSYLSLNGIVVVSNQNGTLAPIPIHAMTEGGSTVYKVLDANTALELYYTEDYDGNSHPAFVVVGNPVVLSSADYTIYANGKVDEVVDSVTDGNMKAVTSNAVYDKVKTITDKIPSSASSSNKLVANSEDIKWASYQETVSNIAPNTHFTIIVEHANRKVEAIGTVMISVGSSWTTYPFITGPNVVGNGIKLTFFTKTDYGAIGIKQNYTIRCYYGYRPI